MAGSGYSPQLQYFLQRLSGFSTNIFKLEPQNKTQDLTSNQIIRFSLPSNALLNTRTFALHFDAVCKGVAGGNKARLPAKIDTLIERVEITAGGVQISQGSNYYNVLRHAKDALMGNKCNPVNGHPVVYRNHSNVNDAILFDNEGVDGSARRNNIVTRPYCIDYWEGFLGTCEPKILDASILPDLVISIYLANDTVVSTSDDDADTVQFVQNHTGFASFELHDICATIETIGLADATYDNLVASMMSAKGFLEIPFKQYFAFQNVHSGHTRFSLATQCLDRVWIATRDPSYNVQGNPRKVIGSNELERKNVSDAVVGIVITGGGNYTAAPTVTITAPTTPGGVTATATATINAGGAINAITITNPGSDYTGPPTITFSGTGGGTATAVLGDIIVTNTNAVHPLGTMEKYLGRYYNFQHSATSDGATLDPKGLNYQLEFNGAYYPQFPASAEQMYEISKNSTVGYHMEDYSLSTYLNNYFVQCVRLNMPDSEFSRLLSGLDTRALSIQAAYNTISANGGQLSNSNPTINIFCECTSTLRVGPGKMVEIIV